LGGTNRISKPNDEPNNKPAGATRVDKTSRKTTISDPCRIGISSGISSVAITPSKSKAKNPFAPPVIACMEDVRQNLIQKPSEYKNAVGFLFLHCPLFFDAPPFRQVYPPFHRPYPVKSSSNTSPGLVNSDVFPECGYLRPKRQRASYQKPLYPPYRTIFLSIWFLNPTTFHNPLSTPRERKIYHVFLEKRNTSLSESSHTTHIRLSG